MTQIVKVKPQIMLMSLEGVSKYELIRTFSNLTLQKIIQEQYPSVATLTKSYGTDKTEKIIQILLLDLSASFGDELSAEQVQELAVEVTSNMLKNISLEDIYLVCRQIKSSKNFGKLNVNKVLNAFEEHLNKRCDAFYEHNINRDPSLQIQNRVGKMQHLKQLVPTHKKSKK